MGENTERRNLGMLLGIISDSHDHLPALEKAVEFLNSKRVGFVIHAGDFVAPFALKPFQKLRCPWIGVFGNNDGEQKGLTRLSQGRIQPEPYELNLDGKKVVVVHDLDAFVLDTFVKNGARVVISGHTHVPAIEKRGDTLLINPGEICGWISGKRTLVLLDTNTLEATIEELPPLNPSG